jgi:hypothetical protein
VSGAREMAKVYFSLFARGFSLDALCTHRHTHIEGDFHGKEFYLGLKLRKLSYISRMFFAFKIVSNNKNRNSIFLPLSHQKTFSKKEKQHSFLPIVVISVNE